jgi:hypothetical protein
MNLHGLASNCTGAVNPSVVATIRTSTGSTPQADGSLVPTYATATGLVNVQGLSGKDIQHLNGLNIQGVTRKAYCRGDVNGVVRASGQGGDLLTLPDGTIWLVATVFESWPDWSAVGLAQQVA